MRLIKWLIDGAEYGHFPPFRALFRRHIRSGLLERKTVNGWSEVEGEILKMKFKPDTSPATIHQETMPDGTLFEYTNTWRDQIGERAFERAIAESRQRALRRKLQAYVNSKN